MNELAKIFESANNQENRSRILNNTKFNKHTNKTPTYHSKPYFSNIFRSCKCSCHFIPCHYHCHHCHFHCQHNSPHNISCSKINDIKTMNDLQNYNYDNLNKEENRKYANFPNYKENNSPKINNNKSNNFLYQIEENDIYDYKPNHNLYFDNNLTENDNRNNIHVINYSTQHNGNITGNNNTIDNHKYHNIIHQNINKDENKSKDTIDNNIEINKSEAQRFNPPQIERGETYRYYHTIVPRKYSYRGDEGIQISNTIDNHRYREIYETSDNKNKKVILKSLPKNNKLKSGKIKGNNIISSDYVNNRYKAMDYFPEYLSLQSSEKRSKNDPNEKVLFNSNGEINYNNDNIKDLNFKSISPEDDEYNLNSRDNYFSSYNKYDTLNNENNNIKFRNRQYDNNNYESNNISKSNNNYNYFEANTNRNLDSKINNNNIYSMPKSFSLTNLNRNKFYNPPIYNFTNSNPNTNTNNQVIKPNNIDYDFLRQAVKLALLKKQMKEQEKRWNSNNGNAKSNKNLENFVKNRFKQKPRIANDYANLLEKTNKLLDNKKHKKVSDFNYKNNYNRNMLQAKLKMWKP
jgi:hypothetical protein